MSSDVKIEATAEIPDSNLTQTAETLVGLLDQFQPEMQATRHEITRQRQATALAQRNYMPDVSVGFTWYDMGNHGLSPVANGRDAFSLGVGINLPIHRDRLDAAVCEARSMTAAKTQRYAAQRDMLQAEVQSLYAQFQQQDRILTILRTRIIPLAEQDLTLSIESYRTASYDFERLIASYRTLLSYRIDLHQRQAARQKAIAQLERAVGCRLVSPSAPLR